MVRKITTPAARIPKKGERAFVLPGTTTAEPWEAWIVGANGVTEQTQSLGTPQEYRWQKEAILVFPVSQVFCLPLWLNETNPKQLQGLIPLQLEMRGLQPRGNANAVFDYDVITQEETRTLVTVGVLPSIPSANLEVTGYSAFDLSARFLPFPENSMILWREQDRLAVAVTRGARLIYYQSLTDERITPRLLNDLHCIRVTLLMQAVLTSLTGVTLWCEASPPELAGLQTTLMLPIQQGQRPAPRLPAEAWKLTPFAVFQTRKDREFKSWRNRGAGLALTIYLIFVAVLLLRLFWTSHQVSGLNRWQAEHAQALDDVRHTKAAWQELQPVMDESNYPLELLLHISQLIPADQLHLTLFEAGNNKLLIKGEAKNVTAVFQFAERIKADSYFTGYTWNLDQPRLLPNDLAQMQLEGTRATAN